MERWAVRKRMRQLHRLLLNSREALERASDAMQDRWMKDTLFVLGCRRFIMMNLLDRELGTLAIRVEPAPEAGHHFDAYLPPAEGRGLPRKQGLLGACLDEEGYLLNELQDLRSQPGVTERTKRIMTQMITEVQEDLRDLRFLSDGRESARA